MTNGAHNLYTSLTKLDSVSGFMNYYHLAARSDRAIADNFSLDWREHKSPFRRRRRRRRRRRWWFIRTTEIICLFKIYDFEIGWKFFSRDHF